MAWEISMKVMGYQNVKLYDGSAQDWVKQYDMAAK